jgi:BioD-like phosphotransacetylase family protein
LGVLYITAVEEKTGKTAICAGLAINLLNAGKKVGYLKVKPAQNDNDVNLMKKIPGLEIISDGSNPLKGRDVALAEANLTNQTSRAVKDMKAKVIAVEAYTGQILTNSKVYKELGKDFLGVVINKVPQSRLKGVKEEADKKYGAEGIKVLGVVPEDRVLLAMTIGELAECIQGKILNNTDKSGELVENYLLGALTVDSGLNYFGRKKNKAAVVRHDRLDMQLAALETPTSCLVLSGSHKTPFYNVMNKAESRGIPIITTETNVNDIVVSIEKALVKTGLGQEKKLVKLAEMIEKNLDVKNVA